MLDLPTDLMDRARSGEPAALGALCDLYRNYVRLVVRSGLGPKLRERVDLSDVVQETLFEMVRAFPRFNGQSEAELVYWLRRLVAQKLADLARYHHRIKRGGGDLPMPLEAPMDGEASSGGYRLIDVLSQSQTSPSEAASRREQAVLLADALAALPDLEAEVLWLRHVDGLSLEAIGERLGRGRKTVRLIWTRGLKAVRRTLDVPPGSAPL
jgi:RNA polymerase sigma-70 factor (ECF subfamily)